MCGNLGRKQRSAIRDSVHIAKQVAICSK